MPSRRRQFLIRAAALLPLCACLLFAGCGQKGDLYLPGKAATQARALH